MFSFDQSARRFSLWVVLPALAILTATIAAVTFSVGDMADKVNGIEAELTKHSAEATLTATLRRLGETNADYARWDDAVRSLTGAIDTTFVDENLVSSTADPVLFDTTYLIDPAGHDLFGYRFGEPTSVSSLDFFGPELAAMIGSLPTDGRRYAVSTAFMSTPAGVYAVAIGPIVPASEVVPPGEHVRFLVTAKAFDEGAVAHLSEDFIIDGLRLADPAVANADSVAIRDPAGKVIGALAWSPRLSGTAAQVRVGPTLVLLLALVGVTMILLIVIAWRGLREVRRREAAAHTAAFSDGLTGLPNRPALIAALNEAIAEKKETGVPVAIAYLDLDGFKEVNDAYGQQTGDRLLQEVAEGFRALGGGHLLARVGGDEFVIMVKGRNATKAACDIGWQFIGFLSKPFDIDGRVIVVGTSVGIAAADTVDPTGEELVRRADVAMYQAKQQGPNRMFVYDALIDTIRHERLEIADDLRRAMVQDDLQLLYQPLFDAETGDIIEVEALLRWNRPQYGPVAPTVFISIAEETGLINDLGAWTLRRACRDALAWPGIKLAVNVSPAQFRNPNFELLVSSTLAEVGLPASRLEIELTESYFIVQPEQARKAINGIRGLGVSVALDDFGTGYSSIGYLRSFTFDKLKLDRSLIAGLKDDQRVQRLVQATIALANALSLSVTAEGVESEEEAVLLREAGCRALQGFHLAKPSSAATISALLAAPRARGRTVRLAAIG